MSLVRELLLRRFLDDDVLVGQDAVEEFFILRFFAYFCVDRSQALRSKFADEFACVFLFKRKLCHNGVTPLVDELNYTL